MQVTPPAIPGVLGFLGVLALVFVFLSERLWRGLPLAGNRGFRAFRRF
jgi:hypothetical protein